MTLASLRYGNVASIAERRAMLTSTQYAPRIAMQHCALTKPSANSRVSAAQLIFRNTDAASLPSNEDCPIVKITTEAIRRVTQVRRGQWHRLRISSATFLKFLGAENFPDARRCCTRARPSVSLLPGTC